jgi:hypothetical protein
MFRQSDIDKALRRVVSPVLRDCGFESVSARKSWAWRPDCVWNLTVRGVGACFSGGTGWPSASLTVWIGVYYPFIPFPGHTQPTTDRQGRLVPSEGVGHFRSHLERVLDQRSYTEALALPQERARRDIWWVSDSNEDLLPVVADIALAVTEQARPWFERRTDLGEAFRILQAEHDCLDKFYRAKYFAERLGMAAVGEEYSNKLRAEANWIGFPEDGRWPSGNQRRKAR